MENLQPPSPPVRSYTGHLHLLTSDPLDTFRSLSEEYGDVVAMRAGRHPVVLINHPDDIERLLVSEYARTRKPLLLRRTKETLGEGLLTSEDEYWKRQRRLATPAFQRSALEGYVATMEQMTDEMLDRWEEEPVGDLHHEMMDLTLRIVNATLFGADVDGATIARVGSILDVVLDRFLKYQTLSWVLFDWVPRRSKWRFRRAIRELDRIIYDLIDRAADVDPASLMARYAAARDDDGSQMTREGLRDEVTTLFLAGHETTANALTFTLQLLAGNPEIENDLRDEILARKGRSYTIDDLRTYSLMLGVVRESLRLYPPAWRVGRELTGEVELGGYRFGPGTQVFASQWSVQRDGRWFSEPETFRPERWSEPVERPRYAYFPFGGGPRLCIGSRFAELEMMAVLGRIIGRFRSSQGESKAPGPLFPTITLRPAEPVRMRFDRVEESTGVIQREINR